FGFSDTDIESLQLKSRSHLPDVGMTVLVFEQQVEGVPVYKGEVLVNVNRDGRILSVGSESFPQLSVTNSVVITPAQAIDFAAKDMGLLGYAGQSLGTKQVLASYGDLTPRFVTGERFTGGGVFTNEIVVTRTVFPLGSTARQAYKFNLKTPQFSGIVWENIVDAQTGAVLHRFSLTMFQKKGGGAKGDRLKMPTASFGDPGGGALASRRSTLRPDVQNLLESFNAAGSAQGRVFDAVPTALSGRNGVGRAPLGTRPVYPPESTTARNSGRGFRESFVRRRIEDPFSDLGGALFANIYSPPFAQVLRGLPDAQNPSAASPLGWFYLPTAAGGLEITLDDTNRATTRDYGYSMDTEAKTRNLTVNSPGGNGDQPFSATLTALSTPVSVPDGRNFTQVFQSNYTEGNNATVADDRANDDETTKGIRGFDPTRNFTSTRFSFVNGYEFGAVDANNDPAPGVPCPPLLACAVNYPASANVDVYPGTISLFYFNNILHDYLYSIGFTEATFNMQQDNFGKGGAGKDGVTAQVQDGSGTDNANMSPEPDGTKPTMQMYLFTEASFRRADGSFDLDVVAHENNHAVNNRAVGKGDTGCVGNGLAGETGGMGEGWGDFLACSMADDDIEGEYVTGEFDIGIRTLPYTNYRWSYASINGQVATRRDQQQPPDPIGTLVPFEVHFGGEIWAATLWDMRELFIMKDPNGVFFDGTRRLGTGTSFYIGSRQVQSVDTLHPIDYRASFNTDDPATINPAQAIVRPGLLAAEGNRSGPLATAVSKGARLADTLVMRGEQLSICNPTFVDSRDAILLADREMTGGENRALIWRAFASHGIGQNAVSNSNEGVGGTVVEDFTVPAGVAACEQNGPLPAPSFSLANTTPNVVTVTINGGTPVPGAAVYIISRATSAAGPFTTVAEIPATQTTYNDNNNGQLLNLGQTFYYQVRAARDAEENCVSTANTLSITITVGVPITPAPVFLGVEQVIDPQACNRLVVSWNAAVSANPNADIVYDVYRSETATDPGPSIANPTAPGTAPLEPTFTPSAANRIAQGVRALSYIDTNGSTGLKLNRVYYYIVQARDLNNNKLDTNNTGNTRAKYNAPSSPAVTNAPVFPFENFESPAANTRFTPPLVENAVTPSDPQGNVANFQRITGVHITPNVTSSMMFAPDFNPTEGTPGEQCGSNGGGQSDFSTTIGTVPLQLTPTSVMEFDHFFTTEAGFDGGVLEIKVGGDATFNSTPYPDNVTTFDLGNYIVQGAYNGRLNGQTEGLAYGSALAGRRAYTGSKPLHHVRIPLEAFAPGGVNNPQGLPVRIRFRMTSDALSVVACNSGWFIDNLVINNLDPASCPTIGALALGDLVISEFRLRGPNGANDEFIELYNRTNAPIIVSSFDGSAGFTLAAPNAGGVLTPLATITSGTVIQPRAHYLVANNGASGYSLSDYGGTGSAAPDATYTTDIPDNSGVALFRTSTPANFTIENRLDAAGFSTADPLYREGNGLSPIGSLNEQYSFVRNLVSGFPKDTDQNGSDFVFVHTSGVVVNGVQSTLGAPGPENSTSPIQRNAEVKAALVDPQCSGFGTPTSACDKVRDGAPVPNGAAGTLTIRRKFTNRTGKSITQLRFRIVDITTQGNRQSGQADLRVLSSDDVAATNKSGQPVFIKGLQLEEPPAQPAGGGLNSTLREGTITLGTPLAPDSPVNVQFRLGVQADGSFRFFVNVEAVTSN
ncbi:MAG TPA: M36 family metallopeptidase, partial [Pyrinomonadaceae bacterium]|nr:M36 family metallopeptidase [Pyrinomonadaceae bacterium]